MKHLIIALALVGFFILPKPIALADAPIEVPLDVRSISLGQYFESHDCPLIPYIDDFIRAADKYKIDWRLLPAISIHESTCGKRFPRATNNPFGWLERQGTVFKFESIPVAIDFITGQLANGKYYNGKTIEQKLHTYCPSPEYPKETINYMKIINNEE